MCYINKYECVVNCLNSELNTTDLANRSISSVGHYGEACKITCGQPIIITHSQGQFIPEVISTEAIISIIIVAVIVTGVIMLYLERGIKKGDP